MKYRQWLWLLVVIASIPLILLVQSLVVLLPEPLRYINVAAIVLTLTLLAQKNGAIVWYAAALYAVWDFYTATPYGLVLFAGTLAMLTTLWLYRAVITNQGVISAALVSGIFLVVFNAWYLLGRLLFVHSGSAVNLSLVNWLSLLTSQMGATVVTTVCLYFLAVRLIPGMKATHTHHNYYV